jgi:hypothetical protein
MQFAKGNDICGLEKHGWPFSLLADKGVFSPALFEAFVECIDKFAWEPQRRRAPHQGPSHRIDRDGDSAQHWINKNVRKIGRFPCEPSHVDQQTCSSGVASENACIIHRKN